MLITFSHEIAVFQDGVVCYIILLILLLLIYTKEDIGFIALVAVLFILTYNNVAHKKLFKAHTLISE
jgi:hypothetical protein